MERSKLESLLGFAARARKIQSGGETCSINMQKHKAKLLIVAGDASNNTKDKLTSEAARYDVPFRVCSDSDTLSHITGTSGRTAFTITDEHFAECILEEIDRNQGGASD